MRKIVIIVLSVLYFVSYGQTGGVKGFIYEKATGESVMFGNVSLKGAKYGASTDLNGFFQINNVKPGNYVIEFTYVGYKKIEQKITVKENKFTTVRLFAEIEAEILESVVVSAERQAQKTQIKTSVVNISPQQMKKLPSIGGEPDFAQYLQVLPGVVSSGDQGGQLYIRGGSPIQNKVLMDGMTIYQPFHSIGFFSVFDSDIIRNADVYTGGFNAQYGGRISSIMDISMRDGNKKKFSGKASASTFGGKLMVEGPFKKQTMESNGSSSYIFSAKTSYLSQSSKIFYNYVNDGEGLPFDYTDLYGKVSFTSKNGSKMSFFGFDYTDHVKYQSISDLNWQNYGFGTSMSLVPENSKAIIKINVSYSDFKIALTGVDNLPRESGASGFNFGLGFIYYLGKNQLDYGVEFEGGKTYIDFYNSAGMNIKDGDYITNLSAFAKMKFTFGKLLIEPGLRIIDYVSVSEISPEPRLGAKLNLTDFLRFKLAAGLYSQNLIAINSDRDVVNLFSGFISTPQSVPSTYRGEDVTSKLQKSQHLIFGAEIDLMKHLSFNVEGYYKYNSQLININKNKIYDDNLANAHQSDYYKKDFIIETGDAYGVDFLLKYDYKRLYFWAVYSLGYVTRSDEYIEYVPYYDRRHNINFLTTYVLGNNLDWEVSLRWNFGSGFAFTKTQGYYEQVPFSNGIGTDYTSSNGEVGVIYSDLNGGRLPYYHRLDASIKKKFEFKNQSRLEAIFSITNVYNRDNIFYFDRIEHNRVNQLPIMPSLGISYKW